MKSFLSKHIIVRFLNGRLSPEEERELLSRKSVIARMKQQWDSLQGDLSKFDRRQLFRRIESRIAGVRTVPRRRTILVWAASVAASILILATVGYRLFVTETASGHHEVAMLVYETQKRERLQVILPDSTKVWLNAGSRIEYPEVFGSEARWVTLNGEAYFDVTHRAKQPFYVRTHKLQIQVLGTQFTASDYQNESLAETTLISGKVHVEVLSGHAKRAFELFPNEQLLLDEQQQSTVIQTVDASLWSEWIHGRLHFDNAELGFIINKLGHWYGVDIACSRELVARHRLTFTIRNESLEQIVRLMQNIAPIRFQQTGGRYQVVTSEPNQ